MGSRFRTLLFASALAIPPLATYLLLPGGSRYLALFVAWLSATALERHRQGRGAAPVSLRATAKAWHGALDAVGTLYALLAAVVALLGAVLVIDPRILSGASAARPGLQNAVPVAATAGPKPRIPIVTARAGAPFEAGGAVFEVTLRDAVNLNVPSLSLRSGNRWLVMDVVGRNVGLHRFDPNDLFYRLSGSRGALFYPDNHGGTGPGSLATTGTLTRGQSGTATLVFQVPRAMHRFALVFEPNDSGRPQVRVAL